MFRPRVIPVLLLRGEELVKTTGFTNPRYVGDAVNTVRLFREMGADEIMILDITARRENRSIHPGFVQKLGEETAMPLGVGGGISTLQEIETLLLAGSEKVILNSSALENISLVEAAAREFGSSTISVCMDVKPINGEYRVYSHNGTCQTDKRVLDYAHKLEEAGAGELLLQHIEKDGTQSGYDLKLLHEITPRLTIPVVALGGANNLEEMKQLHENSGVNGFGVGAWFVFFRGSILIHYESLR